MKIFTLIVSLIFSSYAFSAPKAELWDYWNTYDPQNDQSISHQKWQQFLDRYAVEKEGNTLIAYNSVSKEDKDLLHTYIIGLAKLDPRTYNKAEQYAYWVNLYNALTVELIIDNYPIKSITKLGGLFTFGPWEQEVITVAEKALTLNDIEHRILRPIWQDPRTHYAVNCASLGCPNLQLTAFDAENTEALLEHAATQFINSKKGVNTEQDNVVLSSIYEWFAVDFGDKEGLVEHLQKYKPELTLDLSSVKYDYNWQLNEIKK